MGLINIATNQGFKFEPVQTMFTPPKLSMEKEHVMTDKERNNASVPDDMKTWIYRPEIATKFDKPFTKL